MQTYITVRVYLPLPLAGVFRAVSDGAHKVGKWGPSKPCHLIGWHALHKWHSEHDCGGGEEA